MSSVLTYATPFDDLAKAKHLGAPYESFLMGVPKGVWDRVVPFLPGTFPADGPYPTYDGDGVLTTSATKHAGATPTVQSWGLQVTDTAGLEIDMEWAFPSSRTVIFAFTPTASSGVGMHGHWLHSSTSGLFSQNRPAYTTTSPLAGNAAIADGMGQGQTHAILKGGSVDADKRLIIDPREVAAASSRHVIMCDRYNAATGLSELFGPRGYVSDTIVTGAYNGLSSQNLTLGLKGTGGVYATGNIYFAAVADAVVSNLDIWRTMRAVADLKYTLSGLALWGFPQNGAVDTPW